MRLGPRTEMLWVNREKEEVCFLSRNLEGATEMLVRPKSVVSSLHLEDLCLGGKDLTPQLRRPRTCEAVLVSVLHLDGLVSCQPLGMLEPQQTQEAVPDPIAGINLSPCALQEMVFFIPSMSFFLRFPEEEAFRFSSWEPPDQT